MDARTESFHRYKETCPLVNRIMDDLIGSLKYESDLTAKDIEFYVNNATSDIKDITGGFRDVFEEAIGKEFEAQEQLDILQEKYDRTCYLRDWIESQFNFICFTELHDYSLFKK